MMKSSWNFWKKVAAAALILGGVAAYWFHGGKDVPPAPEDPSVKVRKQIQQTPPPELPATKVGKETPVETMLPGSDPAKLEVRKALKEGIDSLGGVPEVDPKNGVRTGIVRLEAETILELMCLHEFRKKLKDKISAPMAERITVLEKKWAADGVSVANGFKYGEPADNGKWTNYTESYTQWYALLVYGLRNRREEWEGGGKAKALVEELRDTAGKWSRGGSGRMYQDGSVITTALYVTLMLYTNTDWCGNQVGQCLGTPVNLPPKENVKIPPDGRSLVIILKNCCKTIDSYYGDKEPPASTALKYGAGNVESSSLVGGKVLYYVAKMAIAYESGATANFDEYQERLFTVLNALGQLLEDQETGKITKDKFPIVDSYTYAYVMRALAISVRIAARDGKSAQAQKLVALGQRLLDLRRRQELTDFYSTHYFQLGVVQYLNELETARDAFK